METFGKYLERFSLSVDIVREETKTRVINLIREYLDEILDIKFITFHVAGEYGDGIGLFTTNLIVGGAVLQAHGIRDNQENYCSQVALAFDQKKPLWIVSTRQQELQTAKVLQDLWSEISEQEIPPYSKSSDFPSKTSIIIPINDVQNKTIGVINLESTEYHEISDFLKQEIQLVAKCIKKIYFRHEAYSEQRKDTEQAIDSLSKIKSQKEYLTFKEKKSKVFLASSSRAENDVIGEIRSLFEDFEDYELEFWESDFGTGIINLELLEKIKICNHGIFYLSEPVGDKDSKPQYDDNKNVLIEAGMMSAKSNQFENLIIIRETDSVNPTPFDIQPIKTIYVPRNRSSKLNNHRFIDELTTLIERMLFID